MSIFWKYFCQGYGNYFNPNNKYSKIISYAMNDDSNAVANDFIKMYKKITEISK
jgi:hypothetical protein